jgi:TrkA domain protein
LVDPVVEEDKRMEPDSGLDFVVDDLPGIGRSYQMTGINGGRITVVVHHSGRRVVYGLNAGADQASAVELSDQQARKLGAVLGGAFFKPAVVEEVEAVFDDLLIDWVALEPNSPGADKSIAELEIRRTTGVTIIAIIRACSSAAARTWVRSVISSWAVRAAMGVHYRIQEANGVLIPFGGVAPSLAAGPALRPCP